MGLVVVFVLCQSFTMVTDVFELFCTLSRSQNSGSKCLIPKQVNNLISCGHFMLAVNSTVNFVFYMIYIKEFRDSFLKVCYSIELLLKSDIVTFLSYLIYYKISMYFQSFCCCILYCESWSERLSKKIGATNNNVIQNPHDAENISMEELNGLNRST